MHNICKSYSLSFVRSEQLQEQKIYETFLLLCDQSTCKRVHKNLLWPECTTENSSKSNKVILNISFSLAYFIIEGSLLLRLPFEKYYSRDL